jgi:hypothetical protein
MRSAGLISPSGFDRNDNKRRTDRNIRWPPIRSHSLRSRTSSRSARSAASRSPSRIPRPSCWPPSPSPRAGSCCDRGPRARAGALQSVAEMTYEFVADMLRSSAGNEGMRFFPLVFTLFMFILFANMFGMIPGTFTVTSHIVVTAALALLVFFTVLGLRLLQARAEVLQAVRAERHSDLHHAADRVDRGDVVPVAADLAQRASVREHAGRPHHAQGVRRLRRDAGAASALGWFGAVLPLA